MAQRTNILRLRSSLSQKTVVDPVSSVFTLLKLFGYSRALGANSSELPRSYDIETLVSHLPGRMTISEKDTIISLVSLWLPELSPKTALEAYCLLLLARKIYSGWRRRVSDVPTKPKRLK
jgi:hypothetical protein